MGCPISPPPTCGLPVSAPCGLERGSQALRDRSLPLCKPNLGVLSGSFNSDHLSELLENPPWLQLAGIRENVPGRWKARGFGAEPGPARWQQGWVSIGRAGSCSLPAVAPGGQKGRVGASPRHGGCYGSPPCCVSAVPHQPLLVKGREPASLGH